MFQHLLIFFLITANTAMACRGEFAEHAQESNAIVLFEGRPVTYELNPTKGVRGITSGFLAKLSFEVDKPVRGETKKNWKVIMRGATLPKTLSEFIERFGSKMLVGLRDFSGRIDQKSLPEKYRNLLFVVDAECSMNGEDWLLRRVN